MRVSENWLREWVNPPLESSELVALITMAGLEIDAVNPVAGSFSHIIVGEVLTTKPHPQADKLTLCTVSAGGEEPLPIVCGAKNVRQGLKVALAQIGAVLPNGLKIKEAKLRGEPSFGMLCSASELGLSEHSEGILELDADAPVGTDLREYLKLDDQVFDIDLTPNRADCLSILGVAREVAALTQSPIDIVLTQQASLTKPVPPQTDHVKDIHLDAKEACPYYTGRVIEGLNPNAKTPMWMLERLRRVGIRAIHPIVDVTNYVMIELGQPLHAFSLREIEGDIHVRYAKEQETITLLDEQSIQLNTHALLIADEKKALALAGIMGGADSAVYEGCDAIFLESAFFNSVVISGTARRFGFTTDSAQRFERGTDINMVRQALERATNLITQIVGGQAGAVVEQKIEEAGPQQEPISFRPMSVKKLTGIDIKSETMQTMFLGLGMTLDIQGAVWAVTPPSYRVDISREVDLIEEIVRLNGYDNIQGECLQGPMQPGRLDPYEHLRRKFAQFFATRGYHETINYSFVDPSFQQALLEHKEAMSILNPISSELSQMRVSLAPGLLASMIYNLHRQQTGMKLFEIGVVFMVSEGELEEVPKMAGLLYGDNREGGWLEGTSKKYDFYDLKGDIQAFLAFLNIKTLDFRPTTHALLHPGRSAEIYYEDRCVGWCGVIHPRMTDVLDVTHDIIMFELDATQLLELPTPRYGSISKFPQVTRDLALLVNEQVPYADIEQAIRQVVQPNLLKSLDVFDVYHGQNIPKGQKSIALSLVIQDGYRTLTDGEINNIISAILITLKEKLDIILRE